MKTFISRHSFSLLLFCLNLSLPATADRANPKIVIVGAGAAGIAAATTLIDDGFTDVTILEAESRIGGRIHTVPFGKNVIDLGAEWVHGQKDNIVYELASKVHLLGRSPNEFEENILIRSDAYSVAKPLRKRLEKITDDIEEQRPADIRSYKGSLGSYNRKKFADAMALPANANLDKKLAAEYFVTYEKAQSCDEGADSLDDISARDYTEFKEPDGDAWMNWKDKGNVQLLRLLMESQKFGKELGKLDGRIKLGKPVVNITWQRDNQLAELRTQGGERYEADHVIVTVSLGVLKKFGPDLFTPSLPAAKMNAIRAFGFSGGNKIFLEFKEPFWQPTWQGVYFLWRDDELAFLRASNLSWIEGVLGFHTVPHQPNVLFTWINGEHSRHMEVELTESDIKAGCLHLINILMPFGQVEIVDLKTSTWTTDPCYFGGFSYHSIETEKANANNDQLAEPVKLSNGKPILLFAGEATVRVHYATVHGAVESGIREAKRIRDYYK